MKKKTKNISESITENIFRDYYGVGTFIEKSAIPNNYGFKSKKGTNYKGYPDFFLDDEKDAFVIVVEAKATDFTAACEEVEWYAKMNDVEKDIVAIAIAGQDKFDYQAGIFIKIRGAAYKELNVGGKLLSLTDLRKIYKEEKIGECISDDSLRKILSELNSTFNSPMNIRDTDRSLFFAGLMIALKDDTFRDTYAAVRPPTHDERQSAKYVLPDAHNLNKMIIDAIDKQIKDKVNTHSKSINWRGRFSFIETIDYDLASYKKLVKKIDDNIFVAFRFDEKLDILGKAYKIFLSRTTGKAENKNIILTPDHIKKLMVRLARLKYTDVVLDTCMGSGGFLMEAMEIMEKQTKDSSEIENIHEERLYGFENDPILFALACSNMFLHGDGRSNLIFGSSLIDKGSDVYKDFKEKYHPNKAIINPPYENNLPIQFVIKALELLEKDGHLIVIMPSTTLNKNVGLYTKDVLEIARLEYVIKLPITIFKEQGRLVYTSIFSFRKGQHQKDDKVLFYDLDDDGLVSVQHKGRTDKFHKWQSIEDRIYNTINNNEEIPYICEKRKIYDGGGNLVPYGVQEEEHCVMYPRMEELFDIKRGELASENANVDGEYNFITAAEEWKRHDMYQMDGEAIVYAVGAEGSLGRAHYVKGKFMASNLCLILEEKDHELYPLDLEYYTYHLMSIRKEIVNSLKDGTSKLTITEDKLKDYLIEYIPLEEQRRRKKIIRVKIERLKKIEEKREQMKLSLYDFYE